MLSDSEILNELLTTSKASQKKMEQCAIDKINTSIRFQEALFSTDILCCVPHYSSGELLKYVNAKTTFYKKKTYSGAWSQLYHHQIKYDWDAIIGIAKIKNIQTAVCCFYHGEDRVFSKFLENFSGETLILISDTALFEGYYGCEYVKGWHFVQDISLGLYLHMLVFSRHRIDLAAQAM